MSNYISNPYNLPVEVLKNITISNHIISGANIILVKADTIRRDTYVCDKCGSSHKHTIKEYKSIFNKYTVFDNSLVILNIKKRRFVCHDCHSTFTESIPNIDKRARISNKLKKLISDDFILAKSTKDTAIRFFVSQSTVARRSYTMDYSVDFTDYSYLPTALGFDEFKATKDSVNGMAFIMIDHDKKKPLDILPSRKTHHLNAYFNKYPLEVRVKVKYITIDMYIPYINLINEYFPNATIIFDKFHIIQNFTRALNKTRISYMNTLDTNSKEYKRLKRYWKAILSFNIKQNNTYYKMPLYEQLTNMSDIISDITSYDQELKDSYNFVQLLFHHLNNNNYEAVETLICSYKDSVSDYVKTAINTFEKYKEYSLNAYRYTYSNARTESIIGKIKLLKRNAFGFRNFRNLRRKVMYYFATREIRESISKTPNIKEIKKELIAA